VPPTVNPPATIFGVGLHRERIQHTSKEYLHVLGQPRQACGRSVAQRKISDREA
jgi:hypothetical protein